MKAKEYFEKIRDVERSIDTALRKVELMKCMTERITGSLEGEVVSRTRNVHSGEDTIIKLVEAKDELQQLNNTYAFMISVITEKMACLEDPEDEKLLTNHYLMHMPLTDVSVKMHHCKAWAYRRHDKALEKLDAILVDLSEADIIPTEKVI